MEEIVLALFIDGQSPQSLRAIDTVRQCTTLLHAPCRVDIIDVLQDPHTARQYDVFVTPSVLRLSPPPEKRTMGNIADLEHVLTALDLRPYLRRQD